MNRRSIVLSSLFGAALACGPSGSPDADHSHGEDESWAVTAWGERYEIFAEADVLVVGQVAASHTHVTALADFSPLTAGAVSAILRSADGREERFRQERPLRDGIFQIEIKPSAEGTFELSFVVEDVGAPEEISAGRVRVGSAASPGSLADPPAEAGDGVSFLKEQQWHTEFATAWVKEGVLQEGISGPARVMPSRGGAVLLTANVDAVIAAQPWPFVGLDVARGDPIFRLRARTTDRSLPELKAEALELEAEAEASRRRVGRLTELLRLEATSEAELERARASLVGIEARLDAARTGLAVIVGGASSGDLLDISAPWAGRVAAVAVSPGQSVGAGTVLGRLVKPRPLWIEVALRPEQVPLLSNGLAGLILHRASMPDPVEIEPAAVRLVAIAPEIDPRTSTLAAIIAVDRSTSELPIGSAVEAEILLAKELPGIVVPRTALVDDAGISVAYVQDSGESFSRREIRVLARQGSRLLVDGLRPGERLVVQGGAAIRRATLLSSGAPEAHVH